MLFLNLVKLVVDVSEVVSCLAHTPVCCVQCLPFFLLFSFVYLLFLFCCILATEDDDHMVLLSADCYLFPPNSYLASQKFPS